MLMIEKLRNLYSILSKAVYNYSDKTYINELRDIANIAEVDLYDLFIVNYLTALIAPNHPYLYGCTSIVA